MSLVRCSFPNCVLEEHLEGEHKFGRPAKPWGTLRLIQTFEGTLTGGVIRCDAHTPDFSLPQSEGRPRAVAFYADMLGFGWALCAECAKKFTTEETAKLEVAPAAPPSPVVNVRMNVRVCGDAGSTVKQVPPPPARVLKFQPRANSQKLKAGLS